MKKSKGKAKPTRKAASAAKPKRAPRPAKVLPVPKGYHTVTPYLVVKGAAGEIEFCKKALGAVELVRMNGPDGSVMHAEIRIGDSMVMIGDERPEMGYKSPLAYGGSPVSVFLYVADVDALFKRAEAAGAKVTQPPTDMFWGDRYGKFKDPFGHEWGAATHIEDVSPAEMKKRMAAMAAAPKPGPPA